MKNAATAEPTPFEKFRELTRRLLAVPKKELDQELKKYERKKKKKTTKKQG